MCERCDCWAEHRPFGINTVQINRENKICLKCTFLGAQSTIMTSYFLWKTSFDFENVSRRKMTSFCREPQKYTKDRGCTQVTMQYDCISLLSFDKGTWQSSSHGNPIKVHLCLPRISDLLFSSKIMVQIKNYCKDDQVTIM